MASSKKQHSQKKAYKETRDIRMIQMTETIDVMGSQMEVFIYAPDSKGPHPGIILAQHIPVGHTGIENDTFTQKTAERLAEDGYAVAVPFIFHWWPKSEDIQIKRSKSSDDWTVADIKATHELLKRRENVSEKIGIVGHCWGGRVAWLGACHVPDFKACAMFYGGRIKIAMGENNTPAIELAKNITCPVAGFYGNEDKSPSPDGVNDYDEALTSAGIEHNFHRYDGAGHAFQNFLNPERYCEQQSEDAWEKLLIFLSKNLKN